MSTPSSVSRWIVSAEGGGPIPSQDRSLAETEAQWITVNSDQELRDHARRHGVPEEYIQSFTHLPNHHPLTRLRQLDSHWMALELSTVWFTSSEREVTTGALIVMISTQTIISWEIGHAFVTKSALDRLHHSSSPRPTGTNRVISTLLTAWVLQAAGVESDLADAVAEAERHLFDGTLTHPTTHIYELKRETMEARRALTPFTRDLPELTGIEDERRFFALDQRHIDQLILAVERIDRHLAAHDTLLSDMLQVHLSQVSVRQNDDMRKISAWAAILVYPTIIAGIYGMNFSNMPELSLRWGYPGAILMMAAGCYALYRWFKRSRWL